MSTIENHPVAQVLQFENPTQTQPDDYQVQAVRASSVEGLEAETEKRFRQCEGALVEVKAGLSSLGEQMKKSSATTATNLGISVVNVLTRSDCPDHRQTPQSALNVSIVMNQAIMPGIVKKQGGHVHQLPGRETDTSHSGGAAYDSTNPTGWPPTSAEHAIREVELHSTTGATILVDVEVGSGMIQAVVDTACQITVFSVTAWRNLCPSPSLEEEIILKGAAVLGRMKANMARDIQLRLGGQSYFWDCCVAPISDDLILGLDFLHAQGAVVDLPHACLSLRQVSVPIKIVANGSSPSISTEFVLYRTAVIPPFSMLRVPCVGPVADSLMALELTNLLSDYGDVFAISDTNLGKFEGIKHGIDSGGTSPIKQRMRRTPLGFAEEEDKYLDSMLKHDIIRPSFSDWASPPVLCLPFHFLYNDSSGCLESHEDMV
ncbi:hypothetical protein CAPTEDRAFT_206242 [Capitella teleta]|uniref:Peptidase A2 domain-containing protein n=1 Tax=Capitella teleta TaxID=283909 RepID=R7VJK9_CAPTE|nr:hypothetical protein CAPTEDRAFT_206242 [Capitella teleta]|eukprot:ELU16571.1 hypothetical protein CAPTEDRAFT_206242 [Capitella teleta]